MEKTETYNYAEPVAQLLNCGKPEVVRAKDWPDYLALGISSQDIPELIRLATDKELLNADTEAAAIWGPIHAWRALGELHEEAISAVEPLLTIPAIMEDAEWAQEELPEVFALMGPNALPILSSALADPTRNLWTRATAIEGIEQIATQWPEQHAAAVASLIEQMERMEKLPSFAADDYELNAFTITALTHLKAQEALPVIEQAFKAAHVDEMITGPWEAVQYEFGLITKEEFDQLYPPSPLLPLFGSSAPGLDSGSIASSFDPLPPGERKPKGSTKSKKVKQKMAQKSRKKNRKR